MDSLPVSGAGSFGSVRGVLAGRLRPAQAILWYLEAAATVVLERRNQPVVAHAHEPGPDRQRHTRYRRWDRQHGGRVFQDSISVGAAQGAADHRVRANFFGSTDRTSASTH